MRSRDGIRELVEALAVAHPAQLPAAVNHTLGDDFEATIWICDFGGRRLTDLSGERESQSVEGTVLGRSYRMLESITAGGHLLTPLESLGRVVGVLEIVGPDLEGRVPEMRTAARVISDRLIGAKGNSDVVERARGGGELSLAATIQYDLMPIPSYMMGHHVEIGGWIEPAHDIAGDAWDYAVNDGEVTFGIFDSVGHGLRSCQLSMVALGAFRLARRKGAGLRETAWEIEEGLGQVVDYGEFVTATLGRALSDEGKLELLNAGHLAPIRVRDGRASRLEWKPSLPLGLEGKHPTLHTVDFQPGDSVYVFSDGIIEAADGESLRFGADKLADVVVKADAERKTVATICHTVLRAVSDHVGGPLRDDATVLGVRFL